MYVFSKVYVCKSIGIYLKNKIRGCRGYCAATFIIHTQVYFHTEARELINFRNTSHSVVMSLRQIESRGSELSYEVDMHIEIWIRFVLLPDTLLLLLLLQLS